MLQRILVPLDGSELANRALTTAFTLVEQGNGEIILLRVPVLPKILVPAMSDSQMLEKVKEDRRYQCKSYLKYIKQTHLDWDVPIQIQVIEGDVASVIVDTAASEGVDLIVMSTHGRSGFTRWLMGSVTEKVLRHAPCPVLAMRSETVPSRILITLDGSIIAWQSMKPGLEVARRLQGTVTLLRVVNAVEDLDEVTKGQLKFERNEELNDLSTTLQQSAMKELQKNASTYGSELPDIEIAVTSGRPAEGILDYAEQHEIDLIVMTTHGRSGLERWEYGSVSEKVVRGAHCSTLVIRAAFS